MAQPIVLLSRTIQAGDFQSLKRPLTSRNLRIGTVNRKQNNPLAPSHRACPFSDTDSTWHDLLSAGYFEPRIYDGNVGLRATPPLVQFCSKLTHAIRMLPRHVVFFARLAP